MPFVRQRLKKRPSWFLHINKQSFSVLDKEEENVAQHALEIVFVQTINDSTGYNRITHYPNKETQK